MFKKAELSLNIIVMAVIALLILIILVFITLRGTGNFSEGVNSCPTGDYCAQQDSECDIGIRYDVAIPRSCETEGGAKGNYCCRKLS